MSSIIGAKAQLIYRKVDSSRQMKRIDNSNEEIGDVNCLDRRSKCFSVFTCYDLYVCKLLMIEAATIENLFLFAHRKNI